jgi:hypothetical protein
MMHARPKLCDAHGDTKSALSHEALARIAAFYKVQDIGPIASAECNGPHGTLRASVVNAGASNARVNRRSFVPSAATMCKSALVPTSSGSASHLWHEAVQTRYRRIREGCQSWDHDQPHVPKCDAYPPGHSNPITPVSEARRQHETGGCSKRLPRRVPLSPAAL